MSQFVIMGRVGAPFGIKGWNHIHSFTAPSENILQYQKWYLAQNASQNESKESWVPFVVEESKVQGQGLVARLGNCDNRDSAALLTNQYIGIPRELLAPLSEDEFYWADLEGLEVFTVKGDYLGIIEYVYESAGTDIMVIKNPNKEQHIPFLMNETVIKVALDEKKLIVDWDFV